VPPVPAVLPALPPVPAVPAVPPVPALPALPPAPPVALVPPRPPVVLASVFGVPSSPQFNDPASMKDPNRVKLRPTLFIY
jgi:hypothetical protein